MNQAIISGNLTRDPELRYTESGTAVCNISIATNRRVKGSDGTFKEEATFVDLDIWGKQAESFAQYMTKGRKVLIHGELKTNTWNDKQTGHPRSKLSVTVIHYEFMDSKGKPEGEQQQAPAPAPVPAPTTPRQFRPPPTPPPAPAPRATTSDNVVTTPIPTPSALPPEPQEEGDEPPPF